MAFLQDFPVLENAITTFQDFPGPVRILVKGFVTKNGRRKEEAKVYKDDIKTILKAKDEQDSTTTLLRVSKKWSELFTDYYLKYLKPLLPKLAFWALSKLSSWMRKLALQKTSLNPLTL